MTTVTAICPCGASFEREVKRGRPQRWCPTCIAVPFAQRDRSKEEEATVGKTEPVVGAAFDRYAHKRDEIEADIAKAYADHRERYAALVAAGTAPWDAGRECSAVLAVELREAYGKHKHLSDDQMAAIQTQIQGEGE